MCLWTIDECDIFTLCNYASARNSFTGISIVPMNSQRHIVHVHTFMMQRDSLLRQVHNCIVTNYFAQQSSLSVGLPALPSPIFCLFLPQTLMDEAQIKTKLRIKYVSIIMSLIDVHMWCSTLFVTVMIC